MESPTANYAPNYIPGLQWRELQLTPREGVLYTEWGEALWDAVQGGSSG